MFQRENNVVEVGKVFKEIIENPEKLMFLSGLSTRSI